MMDVSKDINEYKKEWYKKAEEDSKNLFSLAEDAIAQDLKLNVIIVKRLPRYDRASKDILGIKTQLSKFANHVYDQLWLKQGSPPRIHIIEVELGYDKNPYLKDIIFGQTTHSSYDGIHALGAAGSRHFTYRAVQQICQKITKPSQPKQVYNQAEFRAENTDRLSENTPSRDDDHTDCEQVKYWQRQSAKRSQGVNRSDRTYSEAVGGGNHRYSVPTKNFYAPLNC